MSATTPSPRRCFLFMPGDSPRKLEKATTLDVDAVIADLEDGVAQERKQVARETVVQAFQSLDFGYRERWIRLNPADSPLFLDDLVATFAARPQGYVLPKVESPRQVLRLSHMLQVLEHARGWPAGHIQILALLETGQGILRAPEIAKADPRLVGLMFGAEDLAGDLGARRTREGWEIFHARSHVALVARAHELLAIDTVFVDLEDLEGLAAEAQRARNLGYTGKMAIHPRQVPVIQATFSPTEEEIQAARRLVEAFQAHQNAGTGAFVLDGRMVDMPMVRAAQKLLALAEQIAGRSTP